MARREALAGYLTRLSDGQPAFLLSPTCKTLRKGLAGGYHLKRVQVSGEEKFTDKPEKNLCSHVCEALMYAALRQDPVHSTKTAKAVAIPGNGGWGGA
jgi:hypothetical protein